MSEIAVIFARREIAPRSRQFFSGGPNVLWFISQASSFGEERAKQAAASNRKGVVGKTGRNAPTTPSATKNQPRQRKT
ncbi:hypothetical protein GGE35_001207 [Rhizobium cellulosilyticum]|uniref:Uncharacterized protein n=1 Tax=Aliirhizobium cellulosilyticum TaxID=393664 RepID=A0A7W6S454_9HYPH|nr:hypothetical protein [Rhizobium cellulosilyticum]MBB4410737.1 hypothetical protein [Rhizobium cellulosilyticum]MBB4445425.1 hypothetical protein [Rhizobium cellulosilyticum]